MTTGPAQSRISYFGYGSLANPATHRTPILGCRVAELKGWRRHWAPRPDMPGFPSALLTVAPAPGHSIAGLLIEDALESLPDLDRREAHYDRVPLEAGDFTLVDDAPAPQSSFVYRARPVERGGPPLAILRSYLDAVLQGFFQIGGEAAVEAFVATTDGWERVIHDDRAAPVYSRPVVLTDEETAVIGRVLARIGVV